MVAQIPLPWQLADLLCAMGLGFLYAALYLLLCRLCRRRPLRPPLQGSVCVYGTPQRYRRRRQQQKKRRKAAAFAGQLLYAMTCCFFTRAWILTESRAAQFRRSMAVGIVLGWMAFCCGVLPGLRRIGARLRRLTAPARRLWQRCKIARRVRVPAARERRRLRHEKRVQRMGQRYAAVSKAKQERKNRRKEQKDFEKNEQKQLQSTARVYYNNL